MNRVAQRFIIAVVCLATLSACQSKPTKAVDTPAPAWSRLIEKTLQPLKLSEDTVVLDARNEFDYGLAHWSTSIHFGWPNLVVEEKNPAGLVDPRAAAQRLSLIGIDPKTPVVVIGYGQKGSGEEGRLAWTL